MPQTLADLLADVREALDESTAKFWTNTALTRWLNDGCRDIARRAEVIQDYDTTVLAVAGTSKYSFPTDIIRVHRIEFTPTGQTQRYPLHARSLQEMDSIWGVQQTTQSSYPHAYAIWGMPGNTANPLQFQVFPVPSTAGTFHIYYYRLPYRFLDPIANAGELVKAVEIPEGWDDLLVLYVEYRAKRKDRDPLWVDAKRLYEESVQDLVNKTVQWHDQAGVISVGTSAIPAWLHDPNWEG